jgi:outer membrane protein assembly factor BamC
MERVGDQRWLVVQGDPQAVWPIVRDFWTEAGFGLVRDEPNNGILETEWYEDKSKIPQDVIRRTVGRSSRTSGRPPRRDKFRTRLEKGADSGTTEIFVSNRQVEEVFPDANQDRTVWQARPADREMEAEMLQRMLVKLACRARLRLRRRPRRRRSRHRRAVRRARGRVAQRRDGCERPPV